MGSNYQQHFCLTTQIPKLSFYMLYSNVLSFENRFHNQDRPTLCTWRFPPRVVCGLQLINFLCVLSPSSPMACAGKNSWPELEFCSDSNRGKCCHNQSTYGFICEPFSGLPEGRDPRAVSLSGLISIILWE